MSELGNVGPKERPLRNCVADSGMADLAFVTVGCCGDAATAPNIKFPLGAAS